MLPTWKMVQKAIKMLDADLRRWPLCSKCGKPKNGVVLAGKSKEQAGLCICEEEQK